MSDQTTTTRALALADVQERLPAHITVSRGLAGTRVAASMKNHKRALGAIVATAAYGAWFAFSDAGLAYGAWIALYTLYLLGYVVDASIGERRITFDGESIRLRTWPVPLFGDRTLRGVFERVELACGKVTRIDVVVDGKRRPLVRQMADVEQAKVLAQFIADELKVPLTTVTS